jgi:hypothetical protein
MNRLLILLILLSLFACSTTSDPSHSPALEITNVDFATSSYPVYSQDPTEFSMYANELHLSIFVHVYNETPVASETIKIVNDSNQVWFTNTQTYDPPLAALSNRQEERWTIGWHMLLVQGLYPVGSYTVHIWITDVNGRDSTYESIDLKILDVTFMEVENEPSEDSILEIAERSLLGNCYRITFNRNLVNIGELTSP